MPQRMSKDDLLARLGAMADPEVRARNLAAVKATLKALGDFSPEMAKGIKEVAALMKPKRAKYGNRKVETPEGRFDSAGEARRWEVLKRLQDEGAICGLMRQVTIPLIAGTPQDRACALKIDFLYVESGKLICEDYKGYETASWKIKRKLFREKYPRIEMRVTKRKKR